MDLEKRGHLRFAVFLCDTAHGEYRIRQVGKGESETLLRVKLFDALQIFVPVCSENHSTADHGTAKVGVGTLR